jgi:hypothetical protein
VLTWEWPATNKLPLYDEPHFTFRFADDRNIPQASGWDCWRRRAGKAFIAVLEAAGGGT